MLARLFVLIGGLIVLALTAALVGPYFVDWTSYRADFEREASRILGREVSVRGGAEARILPFPSVTFSDVVVGGDGGEPAMTIETFSMDAELAPFLRGEFLIFDMRMVRPKAVVEIDGDGRIGWRIRPTAPFDAGHISLERLTVTEGQISLRHAASGRQHLLSEINADVSARALTGPWRLEGSLRADGARMGVRVTTGEAGATGAMRLKVALDPADQALALETEGELKLDGTPRYGGTFRLAGRAADAAAAKTAPPGLRMTGVFSLDHRRLSVDEFRVETGPLENPYTADGKASMELGPKPRFLITATGAQVRFDENVAGQGPGVGLSFEERLGVLQSTLAALPHPAMPGSVEVDVPAVVAGDTTIRDVRLSAEPAAGGWMLNAFAATLPGRTTLEASGLLRTGDMFGFSGSLLVAVAQPSGFAAWVSENVDDAIRLLPSAGFNAKVELTPERQAFRDLELILGRAKFRGEIERLQPQDARPAMLLRLKGQELDVEGLSAFAALFVSDRGTAHFQGHDLDLQVAAGPVSAFGITAESVDTALRLKDGLLDIDRLSIGGLEGASVSATGQVKGFPQGPSGNVDASVVAVDLAPLVGELARRYPANPVLLGLNERALAYPGLLEDARIDIVASAAANEDGSTGVAVSAKGEAGGSAFTIAASSPGLAADAARTSLDLSVSARNPDAGAMMALYGLPVLPLGLLGEGAMELAAEGSLESGLKTVLKFTADGLSAGFDGMLSKGEDGPSAKGKIDLDTADIEPWLMTAGVALPGMGMGLPVTLSAEADYANGLLVLAGVEGTVEEGSVSGDINAEIRDGLPVLSGALSLDALSLDRAAAMVVGEPAIAGGETLWPSTPFQQQASVPFLAEFDVSAGSVYAGALANANDATLTLKLDHDGLHVSDLKASLHGGRLTGLLELKNNDGSGLFSGQFRLTGADLDAMAPDAGITGKADVSATLSASGKSIGGMVASLAGSGTVALHAPVLTGLDPGAFPALLAAADRAGREIDALKVAAFAPELVAREAFVADDAEFAFTVAGGVLRSPPVSFQNPRATLSADLRADLNSAEVAATGTLVYQAGDEALAGSEPALRFKLEGPVGATTLSLDSEPLAQFLTQRALEIEQARVEAMQASLLEKQRLRREARYYASLQEERERLAEERRRAAELARLRAEATAEAIAESEAIFRAEEEARRAAEEEARRQAEEAARKADEEARLQIEETKAGEAIRLAAREKARLEAERSAAAKQPATRRQRPEAEALPPPEEPRRRTFSFDAILDVLRNP